MRSAMLYQLSPDRTSYPGPFVHVKPDAEIDDGEATIVAAVATIVTVDQTATRRTAAPICIPTCMEKRFLPRPARDATDRPTVCQVTPGPWRLRVTSQRFAAR
jgi:hypothetical protein